jgi:bifunctional DNA-binding transcriptional regulator/antitoxin component of YhaV-PrlF toxin-antitoxin module
MKEVKISKAGTITLPSDLRSRFSGSDALLIESNDDLIVLRKSPEKLSLTEIAARLQAAGPKITRRDVERAIAEVRAGK